MNFIVPFSLALKWFPDATGKVSSFIFIGSGVGCMLFPEFATLYINPNNLVPEEPYSKDFPNEKYYTNTNLLNRVPVSFVIMGAISLGFSILSILLVTEKSDEETDASVDLLRNEVNNIQNDDESVLSLSEILKKQNIYLLVFMISFNLISMNTFNVNYKNYGQTFIKDDHFLTLINTIGSVVNIPGRMIWGFLIDKLKFKTTFSLITCFNMMLNFTVCFNEYFGNKYTYLMYFIGADLLICGQLIIMPQTYMKAYGQKNVFLVNGIVGFLGIPGQLLQSLFCQFLIENLGYFWLFTIFNSFSAIAWISCLFFDAKDRNGNSF